MRPRSIGPRRRDQLFAHALQRTRLEMLMRGEVQPHGPRESLFVAALEAGDRPDPNEFIVSWTLLMAEAVTLQAERNGDDDGDLDRPDDDETGP